MKCSICKKEIPEKDKKYICIKCNRCICDNCVSEYIVDLKNTDFTNAICDDCYEEEESESEKSIWEDIK